MNADVRRWLKHAEILGETDRWVAMEVAQSPCWLWSPGDLIELVEVETIEELVAAAERIRDSVEGLIDLGFLELVVELNPDEFLFRLPR